jgi:hypothetical protein
MGGTGIVPGANVVRNPRGGGMGGALIAQPEAKGPTIGAPAPQRRGISGLGGLNVTVNSRIMWKSREVGKAVAEDTADKKARR